MFRASKEGGCCARGRAHSDTDVSAPPILLSAKTIQPLTKLLREELEKL
jgi:hypothetical protein